MGKDTTFFLQREMKAAVVLDAFASGYYAIKNPGQEPSGYTALAAGQTYLIGPSNSDNNYLLHLDKGDATVTLTFAGTEKGTVDELVIDVIALEAEAVVLDEKIDSQASIVQAANVSDDGTVTFNIADGVAHQFTPTDTSTLAFTFPAGEVRSMLLIIVNGGAETINWPVTMKWAAGTEPTLTAAGVDVFTIIHDGNNNVYGATVGLDMKVAP